MAQLDDPFTGRWSFNAQLSHLNTAQPLIWVQVIGATPEELVIREEIVRTGDIRSDVRIWARFDGSDYPVMGMPLADYISYIRPERHRILGTGKKNGVVTFEQTITVTPDARRLTLIYSVQTGASQVERGMAVFDKSWG